MAVGRWQMSESMSKRNYRRLVVWQKSKTLAIETYKATESFPKTETFGLVSQMRRAAISIPANIAEGQERQHSKEFIQFLYIAKGSLAELEVFIDLASELDFLELTITATLLDQTTEVGQLLNGLIRSLKPDNRIGESSQPSSNRNQTSSEDYSTV